MKKTKAIYFNARLSESIFLGDVPPEPKPAKGLSRILMQLSSSFFPRNVSGDIHPEHKKPYNDQQE